MERFYYGKTIKEFLDEDPAKIFGVLSAAESFDTARDQKNAWNEEIGLLKQILQGYSGDVFFEYSIPRLGKRIDVVLIIKGVVLCLEFKAGAERYEIADRDQVWDYALDLKNFHEPSRDLFLAPILVATDAPDEENLIALISRNPGVGSAELVKAVGKSRATVMRALAVLRQNGIVEHRGSDKSGGYFPVATEKPSAVHAGGGK